MGKEAKIGVGIVAILVIVLGVVVFNRVWGEKDLPDASIEKPTAKSGADDRGTSSANGTMLTPATPAASDSQGNLFEREGGRNQWIGARDRIEDGRDNGTLGQPRTAFMPKTGLPIESRTSDSQETELHGSDRFGRPGLRDFRNNNDFGTGRTNVLRPTPNDGALNQSSRRPNVEDDPQPNDPGLGRLRPTPLVQLQPGPEAIQAGATTQAQYSTAYRTQSSTGYGNLKATTQYGTANAAQQGTAGAGSSAANSTLGKASSTGRYPANGYGSGAYGADSYRSLGTLQTANRNYRGAIAADGGVVRNNGSYTVKPNDSFWLVSKKVYGIGDFYKALIEHNRKKFPDPSKIRVGDVIATPDVALLRKNYPVYCPQKRNTTNNVYRTTALNMAENRGQRVYVVQQGDTVFNIARDELGKSARWAEICRLNRDLLGDDYDHLKPGWKLVLPGVNRATNPAVGGERQDSLTRQIWKQIK